MSKAILPLLSLGDTQFGRKKDFQQPRPAQSQPRPTCTRETVGRGHRCSSERLFRLPPLYRVPHPSQSMKPHGSGASSSRAWESDNFFQLQSRNPSQAFKIQIRVHAGWHTTICKAKPFRGISVHDFQRDSRKQCAQGCRPRIERMDMSISGNQRIAINFSSIYYIHVSSNPPFGQRRKGTCSGVEAVPITICRKHICLSRKWGDSKSLKNDEYRPYIRQ